MGSFACPLAADGEVPDILDIPLFPLNTVLFPDVPLSLKIFEQRYLDMVAFCLKEESPLGIVLIDQGSEVGAAAVPHPVGTLVTITDWDMAQLGVLTITVQGGRRFRIRTQQVMADQRIEARVELLPEPALPFPPERARLLPLLQRILRESGLDRLPLPHRVEDAAWVGYRISEVLPVQHVAKQKLLELEDPLMRLEVLEQFLVQRKLIE